MEQQNETLSIPGIDAKKIIAHAEEQALKAALDEVGKFYNGYESPFRKSVRAALEGNSFNGLIELPDILGKINEMAGEEIDRIANTSIALTILPVVRDLLVRAPAKATMSEVLKSLADKYSTTEYDECSCNVQKNERHGWLDVEIAIGTWKVSITLHENKEWRSSGPVGIGTYSMLSLPREVDSWKRELPTMVLDGGNGITLKLPYTPGIVSDSRTAYLASLVIAKTSIEMDVEEFDEEWFHQCTC